MKTAKEILYYWLEEYPLEELNSEISKEIVKQYRKGEKDVLETQKELWEFCKEEIENNFKENENLEKLLKNEYCS